MPRPFHSVVFAIGFFTIATVMPVASTPAHWTPAEQPDLKQRIDAAPTLIPEEVCVPVKAVRVEPPALVPNPDGRTYDVVQFYCKEYMVSNHVYAIDLGTGEVKHARIPDGRQFHLCGRVIGPDGKFYFAMPAERARGGMDLYVYDPAKNALISQGVVAPDLGGEVRPMTVGTDGNVYGGGSAFEGARVGAYQINLETEKVTDYGAIGPSHKPGGSWCETIAVDDAWIYLVSGKIPYYMVAFNRFTREERVLLKSDRVKGAMYVTQRADGCTAHAADVLGGLPSGDYWLFQGNAIPKTGDAPPWPARAIVPQRAGTPRPEISYSGMEPDSAGHAELWYRLPEAKAAARPDHADGAPSEALGWKRVSLQVDTYPQLITRLIEWPNGRLFGTAGSYQGNFLFNPATGKAEHLGKLNLSHGPTALHDGIAYLAGYPGSTVYRYDPGKPWTVQSRLGTAPKGNPQLIARLDKWTRTSMTYAVVPGTDGKIYMAGEVRRIGNGGGFGWWDPKTEQAGGFWEPFIPHPIYYMVGADNARLMVMSTHGDGVVAKLFVYDVVLQKIVREIEPVPGARSTGPIVEAMPGFILGAAPDPLRKEGSILYGMDVRNGEILFRKALPYTVPEEVDTRGQPRLQGRGDFRLGPDGRVWTCVGKALVRIAPMTAQVEVLGRLDTGGRLAFAGSDVYLGGTEVLRRLRGLAAR